jgi:hypothetical protein
MTNRRYKYNQGSLVSMEDEVSPALLVPTEQQGEMSMASSPDFPPEDIAEEGEMMDSDDEMEGEYLSFIINESLDSEEETYLMSKLEDDPQLSQIFDKVIGTASEFSGEGAVEGPGTGVSDSIPARLSEGEFVVTAKAADELGPDNMQAMMKEAEARADKRQIAQAGGLMSKDLEKLEDSDGIKQGMLSVNPRMRKG